MVPGGEIGQILAVAGQPVDRRKMSCVGKALVQAPEAADETFGVHHAGALVESRQTAGEVSRETFFCRHLFQTAGKLT